MRHEGGSVTNDQNTTNQDASVDALFEETKQAMADLQDALDELRARVLGHA